MLECLILDRFFKHSQFAFDLFGRLRGPLIFGSLQILFCRSHRKGKPQCKAHVCVGAQSLICVRLCNPMNSSPPGFSFRGIFQTRILEQVAIFHSRDLILTQGSSPTSPACQTNSLPLCLLGIPKYTKESPNLMQFYSSLLTESLLFLPLFLSLQRGFLKTKFLC